MWKANGKTTTSSLFLDSLFPKTEIPYIRVRKAWKVLKCGAGEGWKR